MCDLNARWRVKFLIAALCILISESVFASCVITSPLKSKVGTPIPMVKGEQHLTLNCDLALPHIFHFPRNFVNKAVLYRLEADASKTDAYKTNSPTPNHSGTASFETASSEKESAGRNSLEAPTLTPPIELPSARQAYILPIGAASYILKVDAQFARALYPSLSTVPDFHAFNTIHTLTLSAFAGFCFALAIYVGVLGNSMRSFGFYSYSFYVASAAIFFLLQEGIFYALLPNIQFLNSVQLSVLFAGLTIFASLRFLDQLLDFKAMLKKWQRSTLHGLSLIILVLVSVQLVLSSDVSMMVNKVMSKLTLVIMAGILSAILYAAYHKVHCAKLVLLGVSTIMLAMLARFYLKDYSPFLQRYGLIIAVTIEALIFAFAAAQKVKKLDDDRMAAFKRAATDPLCHILNRDGWEGAAKILLDEFNHHGGFITLMFIDVDNFKRINDSFGHQSGDDVLRIIAKILKGQCREQDVVGRLGGDEFVVLSYCHSCSQSKRLVKRIQHRFSDLVIQTLNAQIPVSASVGGLIIDMPCSDLEALLDQADTLMYEQKKAHQSAMTQPI